MADWIKIMTTLPKSVAIYRLMRELRCKRHAALGLALDWLCWLDANSTDGNTGLLDEEISDVLGWPRAAEALDAIGWVSHDEQGCVVAVEYAKHNGESAKKRAEDARRQQRSRLVRDGCHGKSVTDVTNFCDQKRREDIHTEVVGSSTVDVGAAAKLPPPPEGFCEWVCALCRAHPSASRNRVLHGEPLLAQDVRAAALEAFARCPQAVEAAPLLAAYFADRLQQDRFKRAFYRPPGQAHFFRDLEDVLAHAERWARETGWGKAKHRVQKAPAGGRCSQDATPEEVQAELARMRAAGRKGDRGIDD